MQVIFTARAIQKLKIIRKKKNQIIKGWNVNKRIYEDLIVR